MRVRAFIKEPIYAYVPELGRCANVIYEKGMAFDVDDEELLNKKGFSATNKLYDYAHKNLKAKEFSVQYEICEPGLAKDISYLKKPFETVEEMREFLSRPEVIKEFDEDYEVDK